MQARNKVSVNERGWVGTSVWCDEGIDKGPVGHGLCMKVDRLLIQGYRRNGGQLHKGKPVSRG